MAENTKIDWTPGPWKVAGGLGHGIYITSDDQPIAVVYGSSANAKGSENAYLISQTPRLFETLEEMVDAFGDVKVDARQCRAFHAALQSLEDIRAAMRAFAALRGEAANG